MERNVSKPFLIKPGQKTVSQSKVKSTTAFSDNQSELTKNVYLEENKLRPSLKEQLSKWPKQTSS